MWVKMKVGILWAIVVVFLMTAAFYVGTNTHDSWWNPFREKTGQESSQVIHSLNREEQVVLLSLGVQDISRKSEDREFKGLTIPGTTKSSDVEYEFDAKIGIEGKDVVVSDNGDKSFNIAVPEFIFIGHENLSINVLEEKNGIISWVTPDIDENEMLGEVLSPEAQRVYIEGNQDLLKEQVEKFYNDIVTSIDPDVTLEFVFEDQ